MNQAIKGNSTLKKFKGEAKKKIIEFLEALYRCIKYEERETYE